MNLNDPPIVRRKQFKENEFTNDEIRDWWGMSKFLKHENVPYEEILEDE